MPSFAAAPLGPPTRPRVSANAVSIASRSRSSSAVASGTVGPEGCQFPPLEPCFVYDKGFPITQYHGALDYILQFANVARPVVILKQIQRPLIDVFNLLTSRFA